MCHLFAYFNLSFCFYLNKHYIFNYIYINRCKIEQLLTLSIHGVERRELFWATAWLHTLLISVETSVNTGTHWAHKQDKSNKKLGSSSLSIMFHTHTENKCYFLSFIILYNQSPLTERLGDFMRSRLTSLKWIIPMLCIKI